MSTLQHEGSAHAVLGIRVGELKRLSGKPPVRSTTPTLRWIICIGFFNDYLRYTYNYVRALKHVYDCLSHAPLIRTERQYMDVCSIAATQLRCIRTS